MNKLGIFLLLTVVSSAVLGNPGFSDRQVKENQKILELNHKFQTVNFEKICQKNEAASECFKRQLSQMHDKDKLSLSGLMAALPAGKGLILNEKEKQQAAKPKRSNADLSLASHKKQSEFAIFLLKLSCTAATAKDWGVTDPELIKSADSSSHNFLKTLKAVIAEQIEQVRKYSDAESVQLQMKFDTTLLCEKKK